MTELPAPVQASIDSTNAGDLAGFLATFTSDGAVDDWGRVFRGSAEITGWSNAEYIGKNVTLSVTSSTTEGDQTVVVATVGGDGFNGPSTFTYTVGDGRSLADEDHRVTIRRRGHSRYCCTASPASCATGFLSGLSS